MLSGLLYRRLPPHERSLYCFAADETITGTQGAESRKGQTKISKEVIILHMRILVKSGQPLKASYLGESLCFGNLENVELMLEVGQLKHNAGEFNEGLKWLMSVESKSRDSSQFHILRAKCHASLGDREACVLALREAHRINPDLRMQSLNNPAFEVIYGADSSVRQNSQQ